MSKATIWSYLRSKGLPPIAVAGIMGNMEAESNCEAMRLQGDFSYNRQMSQHYADMVNTGTMSADSFITDTKGWGLCQWTYYTRKLDLYNFCKDNGKGIEDETTQLDFMLMEMQRDFSTMWKQLQTASDLRTAAYLVCHNYERPAIENVSARTDYAQKIYDQFSKSAPVEQPSDTDWIMDGIEYWESVKAEIQKKIDDLRRRL